MENKKRSVTRDDMATRQMRVAQQEAEGRRKVEAKTAAVYRWQHNKRRGVGGQEAPVTENKKRMSRWMGGGGSTRGGEGRGQEAAARRESEVSCIRG